MLVAFPSRAWRLTKRATSADERNEFGDRGLYISYTRNPLEQILSEFHTGCADNLTSNRSNRIRVAAERHGAFKEALKSARPLTCSDQQRERHSLHDIARRTETIRDGLWRLGGVTDFR